MTKKQPFKYALPRAEEYLRVVALNIVGNLRNAEEAKLVVEPLMQRAYTIVKEIGVIPYRDYDFNTEFLE